jgi:hypothetical protein
MKYGAAIADKLHEIRGSFDAYLIVSSIDLELTRPTAKTPKVRIKELLHEIPSMKSFSDAFDRGGLESLRSLALESATAPQSVWLCETRVDFEREIDGIYERLAKSRKPYDAYDFGIMGTVAWVLLWVDW